MTTLLHSDLFMLALTIGSFVIATQIFRRTRFLLLHPVLLTAVAVIAFLYFTDIEYARYKSATSILDFALGMSVVSLGYLMHEQAEHLRKSTLPILLSTIAGCIVGIMSVVGIAIAFGLERNIITSIAPKSVTVPIAIATAEPLGGIVAVTSVVVFCTGLFGSIFGPKILEICHISDPAAKGFALGAASHGIGTSRAIELGATEGAMAGLAMALTGLGTAILLPLVERFVY